MPSFCPKSKMHELKICRGVICNDTKKWWKIVRGIDLPFQNWHEKFDEFWLENLKVLKLYTLMGCFWPKYIMFKLKKYRGVVFHGTRESCKTWRKAELWFGKWHEEFVTFSPVHKKVSKFGLLLSRFIQSRKYLNFFSWNFVWFSQKEPIKVQNFRLLTAQVKFHQICTLIGSFCWKYIKCQRKKYRWVLSHDNEEWNKIWRKTDLLFQKWQDFTEFWSEHSNVSKLCTLIALFGAKNIRFDLRKYRGVIFYDTEESWKFEELSFMRLKSHAKFEEKLTCGLENGMTNLANFH